MVLIARAAVVSALLLSSGVVTHGAIVFDESAMGSFDLSDDNMSPTDLGFFISGAGGASRANSVLGETDSGAPDIFTFQIVGGDQLDTLTLSRYQNGDSNMFVAISAGDMFPNDFAEINDSAFGDTSQWLGGSIIGISDIGSDVLPLVAAGNIGTGFSIPLGPGQYTFYIQQTGPQTLYTLDFNVSSASAVPEPSSLGVMSCAALGGLGIRRIRSRRRTQKNMA